MKKGYKISIDDYRSALINYIDYLKIRKEKLKKLERRFISKVNKSKWNLLYGKISSMKEVFEMPFLSIRIKSKILWSDSPKSVQDDIDKYTNIIEALATTKVNHFYGNQKKLLFINRWKYWKK